MSNYKSTQFNLNRFLKKIHLKKQYLKKAQNQTYLLNELKETNYKKVSLKFSNTLTKLSNTIFVMYIVEIFFLKKIRNFTLNFGTKHPASQKILNFLFERSSEIVIHNSVKIQIFMIQHYLKIIVCLYLFLKLSVGELFLVPSIVLCMQNEPIDWATASVETLGEALQENPLTAPFSDNITTNFQEYNAILQDLINQHTIINNFAQHPRDFIGDITQNVCPENWQGQVQRMTTIGEDLATNYNSIRRIPELNPEIKNRFLHFLEALRDQLTDINERLDQSEEFFEHMGRQVNDPSRGARSE